ncbi:hypothetical protein [Streptomyces lunaelactis]|uniref:hypothetical protein n=1 Tax=Streptomyces lunaelactis TaxID=1535768 RepID=UPI00158598C8|nr:hypothetical protein [Streptomyces lunaelactis]
MNRLAGIARERHLATNQAIAEAVRKGDAHTPFSFGQAAANQYLDALWERTKTYVSTGTEGAYVIGDDRLPDTADPAAALQTLVDSVEPPVPYRGDDFPMDRAFHEIEMQAYGDWKAACRDILAKERQTV